jgi:hypothetical protein
VQARNRERAPCLDLAGDVGVVDCALGPKRDEGGFGILLVAILDPFCNS